MKAAEVLEYMATTLLDYLEELKDVQSDDKNNFCYGERIAYTECLEIIQYWEKANQIGLDFDIEKRYPL